MKTRHFSLQDQNEDPNQSETKTPFGGASRLPDVILHKLSQNDSFDGDFQDFNKIDENTFSMEEIEDILRSLDDPGVNDFIDDAKAKNIFNKQFLLEMLQSLISKAIVAAQKQEELESEIQSLRMKNTHMNSENTKLKKQISGYQGKCVQLSQKRQQEQPKEEKEEKVISLETIEDYLDLHMEAVARNAKAEGPNGYRYPVECHGFYVLLSFCGRHTYELISRMIHLPSYRQVKRYQKELLEKYRLNGEHPIDGSPEIIAELRDALWDNERNDTRCVLAIDAASINPQVSIAEDGTVTGLTEDGVQTVGPEEAKRLRKSQNEYKRFIMINKDCICKYEFVVLLCPLDPLQPAIPISCIEANNGSATQEIKESLEVLRANAEACGFNIIGYAFDGDRQYIDLTEDFINGDMLAYLWEHQELPLSHAWEEYGFLCLFFDLLHLVKCDRYRKSKNNETCIWPTADDSSFNKFDFIKEKLPINCFTDAKASKMHDDIPLKLFTPSNCRMLFENEKYDLCLALLPSTYILEAVMNETISRADRIRYLTIGFCIIALYYDDAVHQLNECQSHKAVEGNNITLFNLDYCKKYLALCWSLSQPITELKCVRLGSLGTHMLEHLFGNNRRMSKGNDTSKNFVRIIKNQLLSTTIEKEMNVNIPIQKRHSSSGAKCAEESIPVEEITLQQGFVIAARLISLTSIGNNWGSDMTQAMLGSLEDIVINWSEVAIKDFLPIVGEEKTTIPTLKSIGASMKGGLSNLPRYSLHRQLDAIFKDFNPENDDEYDEYSDIDDSSDPDDES